MRLGMLSAGLAVMAGLTCSMGAQAARPEPKVPTDGQVWEHRVGPEGSIHLTAEEYAAQQKSRFRGLNETAEFEVVVSEDGLVESARPIKQEGGVPHMEDALAMVQARRYKPWVEDGVAVRVTIHDYVMVYPPERWGAEVAFPSEVKPASVLITLERTTCYGSCPAYTVSIAGDGTVRWTGGSNVAIPGHHKAHVGASRVQELVAQFRKAEFLRVLPRYHSNWTDHPTYKLTLKTDAGSWEVVDYDGLRDGMPDVVRELEGAVDTAAETQRWIRTGAGTAAMLEAEHWDFSSGSADNMALYAQAIGSGNEELTEKFLKAKAPVAGSKEAPGAVLCNASRMGNLEVVRRMLETVKTLPPEVANDCLVSAASAGHMGLTELWLARGGNATVESVPYTEQHPQRMGALEAAVFSGSPAMVEKMLSLGARVNGPTSRGEPMLLLAVEYGNRNKEAAGVIAVLARAGVDAKARDWMGRTALIVNSFELSLVKPLLAAGVDMEGRDQNGQTALLDHAFHESMVRELLADGADPTVVAKNGDTAVKKARQFGCEACAVVLEEAVRKKLGALP